MRKKGQKRKKSAFEIVSEAYQELQKLQPTIEEIHSYADLVEGQYGVVTYSKHRRGQDYYFLRFHNTWRHKIGGKIHIDIGYVDEKNADQRDIIDTTHLMLDKDFAPGFIEFIKKRRKKAE